MRTRETALTIVFLFWTTIPLPGGDWSGDDKRLQGTWTLQMMGTSQKNGGGLTVKKNGDKLTFSLVTGPARQSGTIKLDRGRNPRQVVLVPDGGSGESATIKGIYEFGNNDELKLCLAARGKEAPKKFETDKDKGQVYWKGTRK